MLKKALKIVTMELRPEKKLIEGINIPKDQEMMTRTEGGSPTMTGTKIVSHTNNVQSFVSSPNKR